MCILTCATLTGHLFLLSDVCTVVAAIDELELTEAAGGCSCKRIPVSFQVNVCPALVSQH